MQAIQTRYHGPTNHRGARMSSRTNGQTKWHAYEYAETAEQNHTRAAVAHAERMGWTVAVHSGSLPDGSYAHTLQYLPEVQS